MSRWKHEASFNLGEGLWKFEFRDDSYEPGDWCCIWTERPGQYHAPSPGGVVKDRDDYDPGEIGDPLSRVQIVYYYDTIQYRSYPADLLPYVIELLERYVAFHTPALKRLAECADDLI